VIHKEDQSIVNDRIYEILFIADPNLGEPELDALVAQVQGFVERENGKVQKIEKWGKKRLSYLIKKQREGQYVLLVAETRAAAVKEVERRMHVLDGIIKFMTVRVDEDLRKAERRKAKRTEEESRKRAKSPNRPAPAAPVADVEGGNL
jgi:small subunit ribosomal protein S6